MNTLTSNHARLEHGPSLPRTSMIVAIVAAVLFGLVAGTRWTLFEAPLLPEAVAASYVAPARCASAPEHVLPCTAQAPAALRVIALHS